MRLWDISERRCLCQSPSLKVHCFDRNGRCIFLVPRIAWGKMSFLVLFHTSSDWLLPPSLSSLGSALDFCCIWGLNPNSSGNFFQASSLLKEWFLLSILLIIVPHRAPDLWVSCRGHLTHGISLQVHPCCLDWTRRYKVIFFISRVNVVSHQTRIARMLLCCASALAWNRLTLIRTSFLRYNLAAIV